MSRINKPNKNNDNLSSESEEFEDPIDFSRSPHKRIIKPSQRKDFVYGFMLFSTKLTTASVTIPLTMSERKESVPNPGGVPEGKQGSSQGPQLSTSSTSELQIIPSQSVGGEPVRKRIKITIGSGIVPDE